MAQLRCCPLTFKRFSSTRIHDLYIYSPGRIVPGFDGIEKILSPKIRICALQKINRLSPKKFARAIMGMSYAPPVR